MEHPARKKALQLLERMDRTEKSLSERLLQAGFSSSEMQDAIEYVRSYGYLNDLRYAENYLRTGLSSKSRIRLMQELSAKGVDQETAEQAWEEVTAEEAYDEASLIRRAAAKKCPNGIPEDPAELRRLYGYLARRGFSYEEIRKVIKVPCT